jgi:hypothetical protein
MRTLELPRSAVTKFDLPAVCVATGATEGVEHRRTTFTFIPMWARLAVPLCGLVGLIAMLVTMKRAEVELPFTAEAYSLWRRTQIITAVLLVSGVGVLFAGIAVEELIFGLVAFLAVVAGAIAYAHLVGKGTGPSVKEITDHKLVIQIPNDQAADAIEARLGLGAFAKPAPADAGDKYERQLDQELADLR